MSDRIVVDFPPVDHSSNDTGTNRAINGANHTTLQVYYKYLCNDPEHDAPEENDEA